MAPLESGWFNILSQGVTEDLCMGKDFGWAGHFPRAGAKRSLWALHGLWNTVYGGHKAVRTTVFFGVQKSFLSSLCLSWWNYWTFLFPYIFVSQQRVSFFAPLFTCIPSFCSFLVSFSLPGAFACFFLSLSDSMRRYPLVLGPPLCPFFQSALVTARPRPFYRRFHLPFLWVSPDFKMSPFTVSLAVIQALSAGRVFKSPQRALLMLCVLQGWGWLPSCLSRLHRVCGLCFCPCRGRPVLTRCYFLCLDLRLLGCVMLLFGFRKCLLCFLWTA